MFARLGVGVAIASLPAAVAIAGATDGWSPWVIAGCALLAVAALPRTGPRIVSSRK